jgi:hypothetical protein
MGEIVEMGKQLNDILRLMKGLHGDRWPEVSAGARAAITGEMALEGCSVLTAAIPIAKAMAADGKSPVLLLAVAAEMSAEEGSK